MAELAAGSKDRWQRPDGLPLVEGSGRAPVEPLLRIEGPSGLRPGEAVRFEILSPQGRGVLRAEVPLGTRWRPELGSACWACTGLVEGSVCRCELGAREMGARFAVQLLRQGEQGLPLPGAIRLCVEREGEGLWACRSFEVEP